MPNPKSMTMEQRRLLRQITKEGLRIQRRFKAEPLYSFTGRGYMKSEGVHALQKSKLNIGKTLAKP